MPFRLRFVIALAALTACASASSLTKRASFELDCPAEKLTVAELDYNTQGISGCGRKAVYVLIGPMGDRKWFLNSIDGQARSAVEQGSETSASQ